MSNTLRSGRRDFLKMAGAGTAAAMMTTGVASAAGPVAASIPVMKVGALGLDYSFWDIWANLLSPKGRYEGTSLLRMRPAYVWDKDTQKARAFADKWECEVVDRYDAMVGKVDAVLVGDLILAPWQHLLLRPYIQAGIPSFLQRHWSDSLVHMDDMLDLAAKHSTPVMATVPFEHNDQGHIALRQLKNAGEIMGAFATAEIPDEPHFHLPYLMMKILGYDVESISMNTDDVRKTGFLNVDYVYPKTDQRKPFALSMQGAGTDLFSFNIMCKQGNVSTVIPAGSDAITRFFRQLMDIQRTFEQRTLYQPMEVMRKKFQCLQTAYYSKMERNGAPVKVGTVPADWAIPAWKPDAYSASDFKA
ncbi:MAG: hypothetical protein ABI197_11570 [Granulicella sp.]